MELNGRELNGINTRRVLLHHVPLPHTSSVSGAGTGPRTGNSGPGVINKNNKISAVLAESTPPIWGAEGNLGAWLIICRTN